VIPGPVTFQMGSPETERDRSPQIETRHRRRIPRSFALATKEVTVAEFRLFLDANPKIKAEFQAGGIETGILKRYSPDHDCPMIQVDWYAAAAYCNWLSQQERLPEEEWCYPKDPSKIVPGMVLEPGHLQRKGYRLPTEAEWEYACRAEAATSRYYGRSEALLDKYAWHQKNSKGRSHSVGSLRPNDYGLFDMLGNAMEWCHDLSDRYPQKDQGKVIEDAEIRVKGDPPMRIMRSGTFDGHETVMRSAWRGFSRPTFHSANFGFRVAKTCD